MGKFDKIVICSDIDGTLIDSKQNISKENLEAISYFKSEGGLFTLATGRTPFGFKHFVDIVKPNISVVCQNGAGIYNYETNKYEWIMNVSHKAGEAVEYIRQNFPTTGIEIITEEAVCCDRLNYWVEDHATKELFSVVLKPYQEIKVPWIKILFAQNEEESDILTEHMMKTPFADEYKLVRSHEYYFEILDKNVNKGVAVKKLAELYNIEEKNIIVIGDNNNDVEMLLAVENSYAVANASKKAKQAANYMVCDNEHSAIADLIYTLEKKL